MQRPRSHDQDISASASPISLHDVRKQKRLTIKELNEASRVSPRHISRIENGTDPLQTVRKISKRDIVDVREPGIDDLPSYSVCEGEIARIACGIELADMALKWGHLRIGDIPEELLSENRDREWAAWLEEHIPDATRQLAELVNGVVTAELQKMTEENTND